MLIEVLKRANQHRKDLLPVPHKITVTGLKEGTHVKICNGFRQVLDQGMEKHGYFQSKIDYKADKYFTICIRNIGYKDLVVEAYQSHTVVKMQRDTYYV